MPKSLAHAYLKSAALLVVAGDELTALGLGRLGVEALERATGEWSQRLKQHRAAQAQTSTAEASPETEPPTPATPPAPLSAEAGERLLAQAEAEGVDLYPFVCKCGDGFKRAEDLERHGKTCQSAKAALAPAPAAESAPPEPAAAASSSPATAEASAPKKRERKKKASTEAQPAVTTQAAVAEASAPNPNRDTPREVDVELEPIGRRCRACGCTDDDCSQCVERTRHPCSWVEEDLCSACDDEIEHCPYVCLVCGDAFGEQPPFVVHLKKQHGISAPPVEVQVDAETYVVPRGVVKVEVFKTFILGDPARPLFAADQDGEGVELVEGTDLDIGRPDLEDVFFTGPGTGKGSKASEAITGAEKPEPETVNGWKPHEVPPKELTAEEYSAGRVAEYSTTLKALFKVRELNELDRQRAQDEQSGALSREDSVKVFWMIEARRGELGADHRVKNAAEQKARQQAEEDEWARALTRSCRECGGYVNPDGDGLFVGLALYHRACAPAASSAPEPAAPTEPAETPKKRTRKKPEAPAEGYGTPGGNPAKVRLEVSLAAGFKPFQVITESGAHWITQSPQELLTAYPLETDRRLVVKRVEGSATTASPTATPAPEAPRFFSDSPAAAPEAASATTATAEATPATPLKELCGGHLWRVVSTQEANRDRFLALDPLKVGALVMSYRRLITIPRPGKHHAGFCPVCNRDFNEQQLDRMMCFLGVAVRVAITAEASSTAQAAAK